MLKGPLHRKVTFVRCLCDRKISQVAPGRAREAEWSPRLFRGRTQEVPTSQWTPVNAMVATKFWTCSKHSQSGRRGMWSLEGGRKKAQGLARAQIERIAVAQWTPCDLPVRCFCLSCASLLTPLDDQQCTLNVHRGERSAFIRRPCRLLSLHGDASTSLLPRLSEAVTV